MDYSIVGANTTSAGSSTASKSGTTFSAGGEDALSQLIALLLSGGTAEQKQEKATRQGEVATVQKARGDYSKEAAFADAQGAVAQQSRLAMEKLLPSITRSAEGAGTSQNSMRALLLQDAANKAAESASALGLKAATDYGGITGNLSSVLEALTRPTNPVTAALLQALQISKGEQSTGGTTSSSSGSNNYQGATPLITASPGTNWDAILYNNKDNGQSVTQAKAPTSPWSSFSGVDTGSSSGSGYAPSIVDAFLQGSLTNDASNPNAWAGYSI